MPLRPLPPLPRALRAGRRGHGAAGEHPAASRRWFAQLLRRAFPAPTDAALTGAAARALGVSERQVRNWLACEHDASLRYVTATLLIAGAEVVLAAPGARR